MNKKIIALTLLLLTLSPVIPVLANGQNDNWYCKNTLLYAAAEVGYEDVITEDFAQYIANYNYVEQGYRSPHEYYTFPDYEWEWCIIVINFQYDALTVYVEANVSYVYDTPPDNFVVNEWIDIDISGGFSDEDSDGLNYWEEEQIGTDPNNWDTDGDGKSDGVEVQDGTDPLNPKDFNKPRRRRRRKNKKV